MKNLSQRERRKKTPKPSEIFKYWAYSNRLPLARNNELFDLEEGTCFACGSFLNVIRAHIIPLCDDGKNTAENIHLLCASCHSISEGNKKYWNWLTYMRTNEWKTRLEWFIKILVMNGVNIEEEAEKVKNLSLKELISAIENIARANGIRVAPKENFL